MGLFEGSEKISRLARLAKSQNYFKLIF